MSTHVLSILKKAGILIITISSLACSNSTGASAVGALRNMWSQF